MFDDKSIMKFQFPGWMFIHGKQSPCYSDENLVLSQVAVATAGQVYSRDTQVARQNLIKRRTGLKELSTVQGLPTQAKAKYLSDIQEVNVALRH